MSKKILLAAAALSAIAMAGGANAASVSARAGAVPITPSAPYTLARELNYTAGITSAVGEFDTIVTANTALEAGTYTVTLTYSGATINAAVPSTVITQAAAAGAIADSGAAAGFTVGDADQATLTLASGGQVGGNTISYTLQIPAGGSVPAVYFAPALRVTGPVSVTASITNQVTNQPVDPSVIQSLITTNTQGFAARAIADTTTDSNIEAGAGAPYFRTLSDGALGTVNYAVASATGLISTFLGTAGTSAVAYKDLVGTPVATSDVTGGNITVNGSMTNLTLSASGTTTVTQSGNSANIVLGAAPTASAISVAVASPTGAQLSPSAYTVSGSYTLGSAFTGPLNFTTANLETIDTEGLTYVVPWVSSRTQGASTGSRTVIRISRVGSNVSGGGNVYGQVVNPLRGTAGGNYALIGTLPAGAGELVLSSDSLENSFGDFGRADIRLVLTPSNGAGFTDFTPATANNVIVKRVIAQPNGGVSEMDVVSVGTAGSAMPTVNF